MPLSVPTAARVEDPVPEVEPLPEVAPTVHVVQGVVRRLQVDAEPLHQPRVGGKRLHLPRTLTKIRILTMMGAHSCGDLIDVNTSHTPDRSPTATLAKRPYYHYHHHQDQNTSFDI